MLKIASTNLSGRHLDYALALCLGYVWARNMVPRSGDGFGRQGPERWPVGSVCLVEPQKAVNLDPTTPNWDSWCIAQPGHPVAPAAFYSLPHLGGKWSDEVVDLASSISARVEFGDRTCSFFLQERDEQGVFRPRPIATVGANPLEALGRAIVIAKLGELVEVPEEIGS